MNLWRTWLERASRYRWLFVVLGVALVLDLLFFTGYYAYDDKDYTWAAHQIANGENFLLPRSENYELAAVRLSFNFPLAIVYWLSDGNVSWMSAFQMLYHLGCVVVAYAIGRTVAEERAARLAAVLLATCPLLYNFAGVMFPDVALTMWIGLALLVLLRAIDRAKHPERPGWRSSRLFVLAGFFLGIAYSVKVTAIVLAFPAAISIIAAFPGLRRPMWLVHGAWMAAGLFAVLLIELVILRSLTGEWLSQLTISSDATSWDFPMWAERQGLHPWSRLTYITAAMREHMPITFIAYAIGAVAYWFSKRRSIAVLAILWFSFLFLTFGSTTFSKYLPQPLFPRYFTMIMLPAAIALACVIVEALERYSAWKKRPARVTPRLVAVVLVVFGTCTAKHELGANLQFGNSLGDRAAARSFVIAFERARHEYPEYPIVLSDQVAFKLLPILLPEIPDHVYWHTTDVPWADDGKPMPKPPFLFLDWTRPGLRGGIDRVPGLDPTRLNVETIALVLPDAGDGTSRLRAAAHVLFGAEVEDDPPHVRMWDATTIQLVTDATGPHASTRRVIAPVSAIGDADVGVHVDASTGTVALSWETIGGFEVGYFDDPEIESAPRSSLAAVPVASEITVSLGARTFRGPVAGKVSLHAYNSEGTLVSTVSRSVGIRSGTSQHFDVKVSGYALSSYRVRWSIAAPTPGALRLDPISITSVPMPAGAKPVPAVVPLDKGIEITQSADRSVLRWGVGSRLVVQYFDLRNFRRMPASSLAAILPPAMKFSVAGRARTIEGAAVTADVEVFAYGEDRELAGSGKQRVTLGPDPVSFEVTVAAKRPARAFRVRWWFDVTAPGAIELAPIELTRK